MAYSHTHRIIYGVNKSNGKFFWTRIGVTFLNDDGSENLLFNFVPTDPKTTIQIREQKEKENE